MPMANRIRELRKARGLTQVELASALGVNEITVIRWERGHTEIPNEARERLACFFTIAINDLIPDLVPYLLRVQTEEPTHG